MIEIFINLKRFDVPRKLGGICPVDNPHKWVMTIIVESVKLGLGRLKDIQLTYLLPEALVISAINQLNKYPIEEMERISIGCQGVFREDIEKGGNFGAFTTNLPATAARNLGCSWSIVGHSEERADKLGLLEEFEPTIKSNIGLQTKSSETINRIINQEVIRALDAGLNVLICIGETEEEKRAGNFAEQKPRIKAVLRRQLLLGLKGVQEKIADRKIAIGYEPIWAIGPGKVPPGKEYISFVSQFIKETVKNELHFEPIVVYGGGLKEQNANMLSQIDTINGGLVALTKFTEEIGFSVNELKKIIDKYLSKEGDNK